MKKKAILIAEKKDLMQKIKDVYDDNKDCIDYDIDFYHQQGHLLELKTPDELGLQSSDFKTETSLPMFPDEANGWGYKIKQSTKYLYDEIKNAIHSGKYDVLIHAGDPDREGQYLVDIVLKAVNSDKYIKDRLRYWSTSTEYSDILYALKNMEDGRQQKFKNLYYAGLIRAQWDWLFGMNGSSAARSKLYSREAVGRVKTVVLKMAVDRENEIANFKPSTSYGITLSYKDGFTGNYCEISTDTDEKNFTATYFNNRDDAEQIMKNIKTNPVAKVIDVKTKKVSKNAPQLYTMSKLQTDCEVLFGLSPDETLDITQQLYMAGLVSYPRSDCALVSSQAPFKELISVTKVIEELKPYAENISQEHIDRVKKIKSYVNDAEMATHGHTGIIPTKKMANLNIMSIDEERVYKLICQRFLSIFLPPLKVNETEVLANVEVNGETYTFKSTGKIVIDRGYTELTKEVQRDKELPSLSKGDCLTITDAKLAERKTTCPVRFTRGSMIAAMENPAKYFSDVDVKNSHKTMSLGTTATRAAILNRLIEKDLYIEEKAAKKSSRKDLVPTEKGIRLISLLGKFDICKVDMSAKWEDTIEQVRLGNCSVKEATKEGKEAVRQLVNDILTSSYTSDFKIKSKKYVCDCPCGGEIIEGEKNYFCSKYKDGCKNSLFKNASFIKTSISKTDVRKLIQEKGSIKKEAISKAGKEWTQTFVYDFDEHKLIFKKVKK